MKIAIYYPWIHLKSGVERTILETVRRSKYEYTVFTNHYDKKGTYPDFKKLKVVELKKIPVRRNIFSVIKASVVIILQKIDLRSFDALLVHSEGLGDLILFRNNSVPTICFCHTPLRPVFDREYKVRARAKRSVTRKFVYALLDIIFKIVDRYLWRKYKYIVFNSKESLRRARAGRLLGKNSGYEILHPGIDSDNITPTWKYGEYFLVAGRIMWTKNIELAIEAFKQFVNLKDSPKSFGLVIAGQIDTKSKPYFERLRLLAAGEKRIKFVINPDGFKMGRLYANCYATLSTAFNEDWGITPIEANAYGKATLAVNSGGFKESQINAKTGFLIEGDPKEFASKMTLLSKNTTLTRKMGEWALTHSRQFSWNEFVFRFDTVISGIVKQNSHRWLSSKNPHF